MKKEEIKMKMVSAMSEVLDMKSKDKSIDHEKLLQHITHKTLAERSPEVKLAMIAAASKAIDYKERNPAISSKEIIKYFMPQLDEMLIPILPQK